MGVPHLPSFRPWRRATTATEADAPFLEPGDTPAPARRPPPPASPLPPEEEAQSRARWAREVARQRRLAGMSGTEKFGIGIFAAAFAAMLGLEQRQDGDPPDDGIAAAPRKTADRPPASGGAFPAGADTGGEAAEAAGRDGSGAADGAVGPRPVAPRGTTILPTAYSATAEPRDREDPAGMAAAGGGSEAAPPRAGTAASLRGEAAAGVVTALGDPSADALARLFPRPEDAMPFGRDLVAPASGGSARGAETAPAGTAGRGAATPPRAEPAVAPPPRGAEAAEILPAGGRPEAGPAVARAAVASGAPGVAAGTPVPEITLARAMDGGVQAGMERAAATAAAEGGPAATARANNTAANNTPASAEGIRGDAVGDGSAAPAAAAPAKAAADASPSFGSGQDAVAAAFGAGPEAKPATGGPGAESGPAAAQQGMAAVPWSARLPSHDAATGPEAPRRVPSEAARMDQEDGRAAPATHDARMGQDGAAVVIGGNGFSDTSPAAMARDAKAPGDFPALQDPGPRIAARGGTEREEDEAPGGGTHGFAAAPAPGEHGAARAVAGAAVPEATIIALNGGTDLLAGLRHDHGLLSSRHMAEETVAGHAGSPAIPARTEHAPATGGGEREAAAGHALAGAPKPAAEHGRPADRADDDGSGNGTLLSPPVAAAKAAPGGEGLAVVHLTAGSHGGPEGGEGGAPARLPPAAAAGLVEPGFRFDRAQQDDGTGSAAGRDRAAADADIASPLRLAPQGDASFAAAAAGGGPERGKAAGADPAAPAEHGRGQDHGLVTPDMGRAGGDKGPGPDHRGDTPAPGLAAPDRGGADLVLVGSPARTGPEGEGAADHFLLAGAAKEADAHLPLSLADGPSSRGNGHPPGADRADLAGDDLPGPPLHGQPGGDWIL